MSKGGKRRLTLLGVILRILAAAVSAALALSFLSAYVNPADNSLLLYFGLFFIPLLILDIIFTLILAKLRSRLLWLNIAALVPAFHYFGSFIRIPIADQECTADETVNLLSFNVGTFRLSQDGTPYGRCIDSLAEYIEKHDFDIVCLQEVSFRNPEEIKPVTERFGYSHSHYRKIYSGCFGNLILSKHEITGSGVIKFARSGNLSIYADVIIGPDTVRIYNNHLQSYNISFTSMIKNITDAEKLTSEIAGLKDKLSNSGVMRSAQVDTILHSIERCSMPAIICGDFNDTPVSYTYQRLSRERKDSFKEAGKGFGATYSQLWPLLRIDYILVPDMYMPVEHRTDRILISDHYPVRCRFRKCGS